MLFVFFFFFSVILPLTELDLRLEVDFGLTVVLGGGDFGFALALEALEFITFNFSFGTFFAVFRALLADLDLDLDMDPLGVITLTLSVTGPESETVNEVIDLCCGALDAGRDLGLGVLGGGDLGLGLDLDFGLAVGLDLIFGLGLPGVVELGVGRKRLAWLRLSERSEGRRNSGIKASSRAENFRMCGILLAPWRQCRMQDKANYD